MVGDEIVSCAGGSEKILGEQPKTGATPHATILLAILLAAIKGLPRDLADNPKYMDALRK